MALIFNYELCCSQRSIFLFIVRKIVYVKEFAFVFFEMDYITNILRLVMPRQAVHFQYFSVFHSHQGNPLLLPLSCDRIIGSFYTAIRCCTGNGTGRDKDFFNDGSLPMIRHGKQEIIQEQSEEPD